MDTFQLIYDGEYVFCINIYYKDSPECKIKICYVITPLKDCILLEEITNMGTFKHRAHNLEKTISFDNNGEFELEILKKYKIMDYNYSINSRYDFVFNACNVVITHIFLLVSDDNSQPKEFKITYKFRTHLSSKHVKN